MMIWAVALSLAVATSVQDAPNTDRIDWAASLRQDAQSLHDDIAANHPGPVNRLDPGFTRRSDAALRLVLKRAAIVTDYTGYLMAMRGYVASFDDGHVQFGVGKAPRVAARWPGFLTGFDGRGRQVVQTRADDAPLPLGSELISCDGIAADRLSARQVGEFRGRWMLASQRAVQGGRLFIDIGNPFVARSRRCRFLVDGKPRDVTLSWRNLSDEQFARRFANTAPRAAPPIGARTLADGTRWFSMSSFDGDSEGATGKALTAMISAMKAQRAAIVAAPRIVLDLRGNGGGSSDWSRQIARVLWGDAADRADRSPSQTVEWRASAANLANLEAYRDTFARSPDASPEMRAWATRAAAGVAKARETGRPLWRETDEASATPAPAIARPTAVSSPEAVRRPHVIALTDWGCGSACLDAMDLWLALGAVHVGQETSADTLYMDVRTTRLPSPVGAEAAIPMKVYRGRKRGSNAPLVPTYRFEGDMRDTATLEAWIADLPR